MPDKFFEGKKKAGLILTEAHIRRGGSDRSISSTDSASRANPFFRPDGPIQWDRKKRRYRTFEEQESYVNYVKAHQADPGWDPDNYPMHNGHGAHLSPAHKGKQTCVGTHG